MIQWDELNKIELLRKSGNPAEALKQFSSLLEICSQDEERSSILLHEALCYCDLECFDEAKRVATHAVEILARNSANLPFAIFSLACVYERKGELEEAVRRFRTLLKSLTESDDTLLKRNAQHRLAAILISLGVALEPLSIIDELKMNAASPEEIAELNYREATALQLLGRKEQALGLFREAASGPLELQLKHRAHFHVGEILFDMAEFHEALKQFESALKLVGETSPDRGVIADWIGATREALRGKGQVERRDNQ